jgi:hypothetical protein
MPKVGVTDVNWDPEQQQVINAPASVRLNVEAGPGAGKTAVACARVAHLIRHQGIEPTNILLISFTRTAVREMRDRISHYLDNARDAASIRISTVDSFSWRFWTGFLKDEITQPFAGFDVTIQSAIGMLEEGHPDLLQYLRDYRHVVVDEAQDLTGVRLQLIRNLIAVLDGECGVTVFSDSAQAIYGFTLRNSGEDRPLEAMATEPAPWVKFEPRSIVRVHRTQDQRLCLLWEAARPFLLRDEGFLAADRYAQIHSMIRSLASIRTDQDSATKADLYMFRYRASALARSSAAAGNGIQHRLRMSGFPACIAPWIGAALMDHQGHRLERDEFLCRWASVQPRLRAGLGPEHAWGILFRNARAPGLNSIDVKRLRTLLGKARPPLDLCLPEFGMEGPILGTIHGSKGREAEHVHLFLPKAPPVAPAEELLEEARVLYVGATRPKTTLTVSVESEPAGRVLHLGAQDRVCQRTWKGFGTRAEFGRDTDTDFLTAMRSESASHDVSASQAWMRSWDAASPVMATLKCDPALGFRYALTVAVEDRELCLCWLSKQISKELFAIAEIFWPKERLRPSYQLRPVWIIGMQTVALAPDHTELSTLPPPHQGSGFGLAPIWFGYPRCNFYPYSTNSRNEK